MSRASRQTPFVGRRQELATLSAVLASAGEGRGAVVLVAGEPGIGKTRLLAELAAGAAAAGWRVLEGRAYASEGMPPYLPIVEALRAFVRSCPPDELGACLGDGAAEIALLLPELRQRLPALPLIPLPAAAHHRYRLFERVCDVLLQIAHRPGAGLLLLLDDLHWADTPTMLLLLHLARRCAEAPLLLVAAYRTTELGRTQQLAAQLAELRRERLAERLRLAALTPDDATTLITTLAATAVNPALASALYRDTEGNTFLLEEVVRQLAAEGRDLAQQDRVPAGWDLPEGVREVIGRRLSRLNATARELLQAAAIVGDGVSVAVLAAMSGLTWTSLTEALEETIGAGILREQSDGYRFSHALIQQTLLDELSLPRRQRLHRDAAAAIERVSGADLTPVIAALAMHYRLAGALGEPERLARYAQQAAEAAVTSFAREVAAAHWRVVVTAVGDPERRAHALLALADAQSRGGDLTAAQMSFLQAAELALTAELPQVLAEAALGRARYPGTGLVDHALLEQALRVLPADDSVLRVRLLSRIAQSLPTTIARQERRQALLEEAITMARRLGDPAALLVASIAWLVPQPSSPAWRSTALELLQLAEAAGDRQWTALGFLWRQQLLLRLGERAAAARSLAVDHALADKLREPIYQYNVQLINAMGALLDGRFAEADQLIAASRALGERAHHPQAPFWHDLQRFVLRCEQERYADLLEQMEADLLTPTQRQPLQHERAQLAYLYTKVGRTTEAEREFDVLAVNDFGDIAGPTGWNWLLCLALLPDVCVALGDKRRAQPLYRYLQTYAGHCLVLGPNSAVCFGAADRYLGMLAALLGRWEDALRHYAVAVTINDRLHARPTLAHSLREHALALRHVGGHGAEGHAQALLAQALALYEALGLEHAAATTRMLLDPAANGSRGPATYPHGLSAREVEVLRLVAAGKSNHEVAQLLMISINTVFQHVRSILNKTGCSNRTEAAAYALRQGLVE